ncbi:MAG: Bax inhibitor-1/YccA family protein [Thermodesulfobacteriota bacterium]
MRSSNPALSDKIFDSYTMPQSSQDVMTINGVVNKCVIMLILLIIPATYVWKTFFGAETLDQGLDIASKLTLIGVVGSLILAVITIFKKRWSPITAPAYAAVEGLALGGVSSIMEAKFPGIVIQATALTFGTLFALLMAYRSGLIKVTENFKLGIVAATGGIFLIYIISFVLRFFGTEIPYIHESGLIGIGFSLFVVVIAALNLVLDFDFIEKGAERGAEKFMEWYAAFGLIITLAWLYFEILSLLSKLRSR